MSYHNDYRTVGELRIEEFESMVRLIVDSQIPSRDGEAVHPQLKYHEKKAMRPPSPQESPGQRMPQGGSRAYRHITPAEDNDIQEQQPRIRGPRL